MQAAVGDFGKALNEVIEQYDPDRILIEPSGVGKLSDVIIAVQDLQNDRIELNGFTTVVDAKRYKMYMENFGEFFANQVEHASSIFLSHQQGMSSAELDDVVKDIRTLNKTAQIVTTDWDQLSGAKMLEVMESDRTLHAELDKLREEAYEELEAHEHEHEHEHGEECGCGHHHHHHHDHDDDDDDDEHECCHPIITTDTTLMRSLTKSEPRPATNIQKPNSRRSSKALMNAAKCSEPKAS